MLSWHLPIHRQYFPHRFDGLTALFASAFARRIAISFLAVFSTIYVYEVAQSHGFSQQSGLGLSVVFLAILYLFKLLSLPPAEKIADAFGFRTTLIISGIPFLLFVPLIVLGQKHLFLVFLSAALVGVHLGIYWYAYRGFFVKAGELTSYGKQTGEANIVDTVGLVSAPVLGAFIAHNFGFGLLFAMSGAAVLVSMAFLLPAQELKPKRTVGLGEELRLIFTHKTAALGYAGVHSGTALHGAAWPLFLFIVLGTTLEVGGVVSAAILGGAVINFFVGLWIDKKGARGERQMIALGTPLHVLSWLARPFLRSAPLLAGVDAVYRAAYNTVAFPLDVLSYKKALSGGTDRAILFREIAVDFTQLLLVSAFAVWLFLGGSLAAGFFLGGVVSLLPLVALKKGEIDE